MTAFQVTESQISNVFQRLDLNNDNIISRYEFNMTFGLRIQNVQDLNAFSVPKFSELDKNSDGQIGMSEFADIFRSVDLKVNDTAISNELNKFTGLRSYISGRYRKPYLKLQECMTSSDGTCKGMSDAEKETIANINGQLAGLVVGVAFITPIMMLVGMLMFGLTNWMSALIILPAFLILLAIDAVLLWYTIKTASRIRQIKSD